jgi:hypothetical protein
MSKEQVAELVRERLRDCHPGGVSIRVVEDEIRHRDDYWHIPVQPSAQPRSTFEYYDALAEVETQLSEEAHLNVWLVPTMPEEESQGASADRASVP